MEALVRWASEAARLELLRSLEERLALCGFQRVAGVDEAGRGALAGPVVAAAVIPDPGRCVAGVDDSKRLTAAERERLAPRVKDAAVAWAVAAVPAATIDRVNILEATRLAMREALAGLFPAPDLVLTDAVPFLDLAVPCLSLVRGDARAYAIASASILAKTTRDRLLVDLDRELPGYGFAEHKGYGVPAHLAALSALGASSAHRLSFAPVAACRAREAG